MTGSSPVVIIGLDGVPPSVMFDRFAKEMPTLSALRASGIWGPLNSVVPPITVPAWSCMMTGRTPGELGVYGFRNRVDRSYDRLAVATSRHIRPPRLWDLLTDAGRDSVVVGVPGTYPPSAIQGAMVSCFLTPSTDWRFTWPPQLREEVQRVTGGYILDIDGFRSHHKAGVAQQLFDMTEQRFALARHLAITRPWELLIVVDMGPDRLHHGFWGFCDPDHPAYQPGNAYADLFRDYYRALDRQLEKLLEVLPERTTMLVVSDHGAQPMVGGFCLNEWLVWEGLLALKQQPAGPIPIDQASIDWSNTTAWGEGGYYGRLFLNVAGREPNGIVAPSDYEMVRQALIDKLESLPDHQGRLMGTRALRPEDVYPEVCGIAPDLIVYFGDLAWRSIGRLGLGEGLYSFHNDTGPDDANHGEQGVLVFVGDGLGTGHRDALSIYDVAPTVQALLRLPDPPGQRGRRIA